MSLEMTVMREDIPPSPLTGSSLKSFKIFTDKKTETTLLFITIPSPHLALIVTQLDIQTIMKSASMIKVPRSKRSSAGEHILHSQNGLQQLSRS